VNLSALSTPSLGSVLLASTNPDRQRAWYERAFGVTADAGPDSAAGHPWLP
jgi:hypothetical protein